MPILIETTNRRNPNLTQSVAAAYRVSGASANVSPSVFASTPQRRRPGESESVVVTIRRREPAAKDALPNRPEGKHLIFRRVLAAYAEGSDLSSAEGNSPSGNRRVIDRTVVYRDRSYF